jgi:antitoxin (DNA-binding transcriptional repressor) of toxin-antitoxin stability system
VLQFAEMKKAPKSDPQTITTLEFRSSPGSYIKAASQGESFVITRWGVAMARLMPPPPPNPLNRRHNRSRGETQVNILTEIENVEHSTVAWFAKEYQSLFKELPAIDALADRVCPWASVLLQTVVTAEAGAPAGTLVASIIKDAQSDLDVANAAIHDVGATPTIATAISATQANLFGLLTDAHVKNSTSQATITKVVNELGSLSQAVTNSVPPLPAATGTAAAAAA